MGVVGMIFGVLMTWPNPLEPIPDAGDNTGSENE